jgi:hypothetical protein
LPPLLVQGKSNLAGKGSVPGSVAIMFIVLIIRPYPDILLAASFEAAAAISEVTDSALRELIELASLSSAVVDGTAEPSWLWEAA